MAGVSGYGLCRAFEAGDRAGMAVQSPGRYGGAAGGDPKALPAGNEADRYGIRRGSSDLAGSLPIEHVGALIKRPPTICVQIVGFPKEII